MRAKFMGPGACYIPLIGKGQLLVLDSSQKAVSSFALKKHSFLSSWIESPGRVMRGFKFIKREQKEEEGAYTWEKGSHSS